jgi:hypothetical protein
MIAGATSKEPYEEFPVSVDFLKYLTAGQTITQAAVISRSADTGADTTTTLLSGSPIIQGTKVGQRVKGGASGDRHILEYRIVDSDGNRWEAEVAVTVQEE